MTGGAGHESRPASGVPPPAGKPASGTAAETTAAAGTGEGAPPPPKPTPSSSGCSSDSSAAGPKPAAAASSSSSESGTSPRSSPDPESPPYTHPHFASAPDIQEMQPELESDNRRRGLAGLAGVPSGVGMGGNRAPTRWSYMYDGVMTRTGAALMRPILHLARHHLAAGAIVDIQENMERVVRDNIERNFDAQEFLEGVRYAVPVFYEALGSGDEEAMKRMVSPKVLEVVKRDRRALLEEKKLELTGVDASVNDTILGQVSLWGADAVATFDPALAAAATPQSSRSWLVAMVHVDATLHCKYKMPTLGPLKTPEGKELAMPEVGATIARRGTWLLARGPLPRGISNSLDTPWRVLAWW